MSFLQKRIHMTIYPFDNLQPVPRGNGKALFMIQQLNDRIINNQEFLCLLRRLDETNVTDDYSIYFYMFHDIGRCGIGY